MSSGNAFGNQRACGQWGRVWVMAAVLVGATAGGVRANNYFWWEATKVNVGGQNWYLPIVRLNMEPYSPTAVFVHQPGDAAYRPVDWVASQDSWYWKGSARSQPTFDGGWGLKVVGTGGREWQFTFTIDPMAEGEFAPALSITEPAGQNAVITPSYTFRWNPNGADQVADHLWLQVAGDTLTTSDMALPLSTTQWTPAAMPSGAVVFKPAYVRDANAKMSDFALAAGEAGSLALPEVSAYLISGDSRNVTVVPEPAALSVVVLVASAVLIRTRRSR